MKYALVTTQYGSEMFVADKSKTPCGMPVTDTVNEALIFDERDNPETKLHYYRKVYGYDFVIKNISEPATLWTPVTHKGGNKITINGAVIILGDLQIRLKKGAVLDADYCMFLFGQWQKHMMYVNGTV